MAKKNTKHQKRPKVKLYADPQTRAFLAEEWLHVTPFEGRGVLPRILSQIGMSGNVTAVWQRKKNLVDFYLSNDKITLKIFPSIEPLSTSACIIPDYKDRYSRHFAIMDDESSMYFYNLCNNELTPCFIKTHYDNGCSCMQVSKATPTVKVSFEVPKLFGNSVLFTIVIRNNVSSRKIVEGYSKKILNILNDGNGKNVYMYYDSISKFLNHVVSDFTVSFKAADGSVTDEIVIENNFCEKFTVTSKDNTTITVFRNHDWIYKSEFLNAKRLGENFSFSSNLSEYQIDQLQDITTIDHEIRKFISNNMWFAFSEGPTSKL